MRMQYLSRAFWVIGSVVLLWTDGVQAGDSDPDEPNPGGEEVGSVAQTLVDTSYFSAHTREGGILVSWGTVSEIDSAGFNILRRVSGEGQFVQVNETLLPPTGPAGGHYEYLDEPLEIGTYDYQLEEIDTQGFSTILTGPVTVSVFGDEEDDLSCAITGVPSGKSRGPGLVLLALVGLLIRRRAQSS